MAQVNVKSLNKTALIYDPETTTAYSNAALSVVGSDRLYVTYSLFSEDGSAQIYFEYSDDQARSWSAPKLINGSGAFCAPGGHPPSRKVSTASKNIPGCSACGPSSSG